jgi:hypothetical protein
MRLHLRSKFRFRQVGRRPNVLMKGREQEAVGRILLSGNNTSLPAYS